MFPFIVPLDGPENKGLFFQKNNAAANTTKAPFLSVENPVHIAVSRQIP
ncbi:hypothetical protein [uncultured Dysosmobacter sp.]|nr:hypothetical protein [uncultured Dysosmobacter sp.]